MVGMEFTEMIEGKKCLVKVWRYPNADRWLIDGPGPTIDTNDREAAHNLACAIADGVVANPWFAEGGQNVKPIRCPLYPK